MAGRVWASGLMLWSTEDLDFRDLSTQYVKDGKGNNFAEPVQTLRDIPKALAPYKNLEQVIFATHGAPGAVRLAKAPPTLGQFPWFHAPHDELFRADGRVLFWGCDIAKGAAGLLFLERVGRMMFAGRAGMVAASDSKNYKLPSIPIDPMLAPFGALHMVYLDANGNVTMRQTATNG
jgi:hypothetical protein